MSGGFDSATGTITTDVGQRLGPDLTLDAFLASGLAVDATSLVENGPHRSWSVTATISGRPFHVGLFFDEQRLMMVVASLDDPAFGRDWADWSRERELARKTAHAVWLASMDPSIGEGRAFPWGFVASVFDEKSGGSEIVLRYGAALPERYVSPYPAIDFGGRPGR